MHSFSTITALYHRFPLSLELPVAKRRLVKGNRGSDRSSTLQPIPRPNVTRETKIPERTEDRIARFNYSKDRNKQVSSKQ